MTSKRLVLAFMVLCACSWAAPRVRAQEPSNLESLKGLHSVLLRVEGFTSDSDLERAGVTVDRLKTDLTQRLSKAGIQVLTVEEWTKTPGRPYLYLNITPWKSEIGFYAYSIEIHLGQEVLLARDPSVRVLAPTWKKSWVGVAGTGNLPSITVAIDEQVDRFITAFTSIK